MSAAFARFRAYLRHRPVIVSCMALVVLLAGLNYFLWRERTGVSRRHDEARHNGEFMLDALGRRGRIDADLAALHEAMAQIDGNLLDEGSMEVNLGYFYRIEKLTRVHLLRLNQLSAPVLQPGARYKAVPFSMQLTGPYRSDMNFLRALETGPRILRVRTCSFERTGGASTDLIMELTVDVLAHK